MPRAHWEWVASPWDQQSGIRLFPHPTGPQCSPKPLGLSKLDAAGRRFPGKKAIHAFPWCFFKQRIRREEQPGCCHHTQAALGKRESWSWRLQELFGVRNPPMKQNPRWGLLHPHLVSGLEKGHGGMGGSVGCLGSLIPCFPSAGRCHDESAEWTLP